MRGLGHGVACLVVLLVSLGAPGLEATDERVILGWIEEVVIGDGQLRLEAKLDTGADTSSLDAKHIRRLRRKSSGERFVEFDVLDPSTGDRVRFKEPLVRMARIKQHSGRSQERPVVALDVCVGSISRRVEFTLADRRVFDYPVLLGREAMEGVIIVDPAIEATSEPTCAAAESAASGSER